MKPGDRVIDKFWGAGVIIRLDCGIKGLHLVKFDIDPPVRYNMGENPCVVFEDDLTLEA